MMSSKFLLLLKTITTVVKNINLCYLQQLENLLTFMIGKSDIINENSLTIFTSQVERKYYKTSESLGVWCQRPIWATKL